MEKLINFLWWTSTINNAKECIAANVSNSNSRIYYHLLLTATHSFFYYKYLWCTLYIAFLKNRNFIRIYMIKIKCRISISTNAIHIINSMIFISKNHPPLSRYYISCRSSSCIKHVHLFTYSVMINSSTTHWFDAIKRKQH